MKKMQNQSAADESSYLFQVDILVHAPTNGAALERLLNVLNESPIADYRIQSGVQLGRLIEEEMARSQPVPVPLPAEKPSTLEGRIRDYIESNKLIRINVNKGKGVKLSLPCRIVSFDPNRELLTLYHVDEKKVYTVKLNEVDDFVE